MKGNYSIRLIICGILCSMIFYGCTKVTDNSASDSATPSAPAATTTEEYNIPELEKYADYDNN